MPDKITAITVSVDYGDLLGVTLVNNAFLFDRHVIVTAKHDAETIEVCKRHNVECFVTNAFYERGAAFNKGAAIERAFDFVGRNGWFCLLDADVILPLKASLHIGLDPSCLYVPERYVAPNPRLVVGADFHPANWENNFSLRSGEEFAGYCQIFHSSAEPLKSRPWYPTNWKHAGGADSEFWRKWSIKKRLRPPFRVLHLGPDGVNWAGRVSERLDGTSPPDAAQRAARLRRFIEDRDLPEYRGRRHDHEKIVEGT